MGLVRLLGNAMENLRYINNDEAGIILGHVAGAPTYDIIDIFRNETVGVFDAHLLLMEVFHASFNASGTITNKFD